MITLQEAIDKDIPVLCRLVCSKPQNEIINFQDLKSHTHFEYQTQEGEQVDVSDIKEWPNRWPHGGTYTAKWKNYSKDEAIKDTKIQDKVLRVVLRTFGLTIKNIKLKWERDSSKDTNFNLEWDSNIATFGNNRNVLAQAYLPTSNPLHSQYSGLIQVNDLWNWAVYGKNGARFLLQVLIHEFFHSLGFVHDEQDPNSTLWPYANGKIIFTLRDLARLWRDYGRRWIPQWLINTMNRRIIKGLDFD